MRDNILEIFIALTVILVFGSILTSSILSNEKRLTCRLHGMAAGYTASDITVICK